jgi:hypothetical protein
LVKPPPHILVVLLVPLRTLAWLVKTDSTLSVVLWLALWLMALKI